MLSVLLLIPPSLPKLKIQPADLVRLDGQLPLSASVKIMVEFAQIQEGVLDILNHTSKNDQVTVIKTWFTGRLYVRIEKFGGTIYKQHSWVRRYHVDHKEH
ncbi:hypothetical protein N7462_004062 [Penicillium macrosclerotiorum]|uniref:uncharacterized protein n=1 Tax=Penicillium macrosclerotiorum TaxID=303699 RepID=UPI0025491B94|nr:uncharacterized protein N7462_004062 [Penicillium macrosclerotiorum]KAJ5689670.1 hypothetical protein N7462_004062 [Penicillium macrosclerotiorum]